MTLLVKLEWALHTIREMLDFGLGEADGIKLREIRMKDVLIDADKDVLQIDKDLRWLVGTVENLKPVADDLDYDEDESEESEEVLNAIKERYGIK